MNSNSKNSEILEATLNKITNIQIIIDTNKIQNNYPNGGSKDSTNPTGIGYQYQYMVCSNSTGSTGSSTEDLTITALVGDIVRFNAVSEFDNFSSAVVIYNVQKSSGTNVFGDFTSEVFTAPGIQPSPEAPLPIQVVNTMTYWFYKTYVIRTGKEYYDISFALYTLDRAAGTMKLFGYFQCGSRITVEG